MRREENRRGGERRRGGTEASKRGRKCVALVRKSCHRLEGKNQKEMPTEAVSSSPRLRQGSLAEAEPGYVLRPRG